MKLRSVCALVAAMSFGSALAANTWYVDDDWYEKGGDGSTNAPYGTIQDAIKASATKSGDTILVLPGVYDKGVQSNFYVKTRVAVTKNNLTIKSTDGADVTHIVGYKDPEAPEKYHGAWSNAVACVIVSSDAPTVVIEGFTIRDGACCSPRHIDSNSGYNNGGGVSKDYGEGFSDALNRPHVIDCVISNCVGRLGICNSCTLHRCLVTKNIAIGNTGGTSGYGAGLGYGRAENTLFIENTGGSGVFASSIVNCLVTGTVGNNYGPSRMAAYNSIYAGNYVDWDDEWNNSWNKSKVCFTNSVSTGRGDNNAPERYGTSSNSVFSAAYTNLFLASALRDFRLIADSCAVGRGDPKFLSAVAPLPEGYAYKDFYGREIDLASETINAGISQETVTPRSGCATFALGEGNTYDMVKVDGVPLYTPYGNCVWSTNALEQLCVTGARPDTNPLSCVQDSSTNIYHFVTRDGRVLVTLPRAGATKTLTAECAMKIFYVDPTHGDNSFDGSCAWEDADVSANKGPWRTLLYAGTNVITKSSQRYLVRCAPGNYAEEETGGKYHARVRVLSGRKLHFDATAGVSETAIVGAPDPDPSYGTELHIEGCGPNAIRCIVNDAWGTGFTGFTLTNGYTTSENVWPYYQGACVYVNEGKITLSDCVLTGNGSREGITGGAEDSLYLSRCLIADNWGRIGIFCGSCATLSGCILKDNYVINDNGWLYSSKNAINCTFYVSPSFTSGTMIKSDGNRLFNCIFVNSTTMKKANPCRGSVLENCTGTMTGFSNDCVRGQAFLARPSENDFRLGADSAAWRSPVDDFDMLTTHLDADYFGQPIIAGGKVVAAGAVMAKAPDCVCVENGEKRLTVSGLPADANRVRSGEAVTIAPNAATKRPVIGLVVNGVTNLFGTAASLSYSYADVTAAGGALSVQPVATADWYVNPNTDSTKGFVGDDANHGYSPEFPKRTLKGVATVAVSNDVIHAAAGVYDSETMNAKVSIQPSRVEIPGFVTLVSDEGRERTIIKGKAGADANGFGAGAVRCVYLCEGAVIRGFTLTGGHIVNTNISVTTSYGGAGVCSYGYQSRNAYVEDCIISNCVGNLCVLLSGTFRRCEVVENRSLCKYMSYGSLICNSLFARNSICNSSTPFFYGRFEGLTFAADNVGTNGAPVDWTLNTGDDYCVNSVVFGQVSNGAAVTNTVLTSGSIGKKFVNCRKMTAEDIALDGNYRPIFGVSKLIDAGTNACLTVANYETWGGLDLAGNPRVSNGTIDIGAFEADWRPVYSARLGRDVTVAEASPSVVTNDAGGVSLGADGTLALVWALDGVRGEVTVDVTGTGVLTVSRNGEVEATFTAASDPKVYAIHPEDAADQRLAFAYTPGDADDGTAAILRCKRQIGMMLIVR